jgi:hypothetical protein
MNSMEALRWLVVVISIFSGVIIIATLGSLYFLRAKIRKDRHNRRVGRESATHGHAV